MIDVFERDLRAPLPVRNRSRGELLQFIIPAAISAGASLIGGAMQRDAADDAADEYAAATAQANAYRQQIIDMANQWQTPGLASLAQMSALTGGSGSAGGVNWARYVTETPDILANWNAMTESDKAPFNGDIAKFGQFHYNDSLARGQTRDLEPFTTQPGDGPATPTNPLQPDDAPEDFPAQVYGPPIPARPEAPARPTTAPRPTVSARPVIPEVPVFNRPDTGPAPVYERPDTPDRPVMVRPDAPELDISVGSYQQSPDYNFQLSEGNRNIMAQRAALGSLDSGAAMKELQEFGQNLALGDYNQWRDYTTDQWRFNTNRLDNNFNFDSRRSDANYEWDTDLLMDNFESDRDYGTGLWKYNTDRSDRNFENDRRVGLDTWRYTNDMAQRAYEWDNSFAQRNWEADRDFADSNFESDRAYGDNLYNTDRQYTTQRFDQYMNDMYRIAGLGLNALGISSGQASGQAQAAQNNGQVQGQSQVAQGNINSGMVGDIAGAITSGLQSWMGSQGGYGSVTPIDAFVPESISPYIPQQNAMFRPLPSYPG